MICQHGPWNANSCRHEGGRGQIWGKIYRLPLWTAPNLICKDSLSITVKYNFISLYFQSWMDKAPMNEGRGGVASATLMNKLYACGGCNTQERLCSAEIYDPVLDVWGFLPQMTEVRVDAACVAFNNRIYVIGGFNGDQIHTSVEIFNPATNEWSFGPSLQVPRSGVKAIAYNDKIFVIGGYDGTRRLKTVEVYDPLVSPYFQLQAKQLMQRRSNFAVTLTDDKIFVMGGYDGRRVTAKTEMYDDKDKEWKASKAMKFARSALETLTLDHYTLNYEDFFLMKGTPVLVECRHRKCLNYFNHALKTPSYLKHTL